MTAEDEPGDGSGVAPAGPWVANGLSPAEVGLAIGPDDEVTEGVWLAPLPIASPNGRQISSARSTIECLMLAQTVSRRSGSPINPRSRSEEHTSELQSPVHL